MVLASYICKQVPRTVFRPHPDVAVTRDVSRNVTGNVGVSGAVGIPLKDRQRWFLECLGAGRQVRADDLARQFDKAVRTAERDIAVLEQAGVIEYVGARRNGFYRVKGQGP